MGCIGGDSLVEGAGWGKGSVWSIKGLRGRTGKKHEKARDGGKKPKAGVLAGGS